MPNLTVIMFFLLQNKLLYAEFVKFDSDKAEPIRDENGLCIPVKRSKLHTLALDYYFSFNFKHAMLVL